MITDITLRKRGSFSNSPAARRVRRDFALQADQVIRAIRRQQGSTFRALLAALEGEASNA